MGFSKAQNEIARSGLNKMELSLFDKSAWSCKNVGRGSVWI